VNPGYCLRNLFYRDLAIFMTTSSTRPPFRASRALAAFALFAVACQEPAGRDELEAAHDEPSDLEPVDNEKFDGPLEAFTADLLFEDAMFINSSAVTVQGIQDLLEVSPYGARSFLADEKIGGQPFSQVLVDVAKSKQVNPVLLLVRLQVEKSLISKSTRPTGNTIDFALGCGCPDRKACNEVYRGLDKQLTCGADTLRKHYDGSVAGTGAWRVGRSTTTLDPRSITPRSHGTASLYAYTPWVLEGSGGNWLVWNISRKYISAMIDRGTWGTGELPDDPDMGALGSCEDQCGSTSAVSQGDGQACFCDDECGTNGDCCDDYPMVCEGDPTDTGDDSTGDDPTGDDPTDTGDDPVGGSCDGYCGSQSGIDNGDGTSCYCDTSCDLSGDCCSDYDAVCGDEPMAGGSCAGACGSADPTDVGDGTSCYCDELCASNGDCCGDYDAEC